MIESMHINRKLYIRLFSKLLGTRSFQNCWTFTGALDHPPNGYGRLKVNGLHKKAHRVIYEMFYGPIKPGNVILHSCDNKRCCNPLHLTQGTQKENIADCIKKGRFHNIKNWKKRQQNG